MIRNMLRSSLVVLMGVGMVVGFCPVAAAEMYEIDPDHSSVMFKVKHLGISTVTGSFLEVTGSIDFDSAKLGEAKTSAVIKAASVNTRNEKRDEHLRGEDFLEVSTYPLILFKSTKVVPGAEGHFTVEGELHLHGTVKPVTLDAEFTGSAVDPWGAQRVGFVATTTINRKDFGVKFSKLMDNGGMVVGDEVQVTLEIEGKVAKKAS